MILLTHETRILLCVVPVRFQALCLHYFYALQFVDLAANTLYS